LEIPLRDERARPKTIVERVLAPDTYLTTSVSRITPCCYDNVVYRGARVKGDPERLLLFATRAPRPPDPPARVSLFANYYFDGTDLNPCGFIEPRSCNNNNNKAAKNVGLEMNEEKTEYMEVRRRRDRI